MCRILELLLLLLVMQLAFASDNFVQEIELIRTSDEQMVQKMDQLQKSILDLKLELKNSQTSTVEKEQKVKEDLKLVREQQVKTESLIQENTKVLKQLADFSLQDKQCNCVLEKLAPMNNQLLESAKLVRGLVENSTEILQQVQDTKTIVQDHGLAISEIKQIIHDFMRNRAETTDASPVAREEASTAETTVATTKAPKHCFKPHASVDKSRLIYGKKAVFYYQNTPMNWINAHNFCQRIGMALPHLKTQSEIDEVKTKIKEDRGYGVWLSASNRVPYTTQFHWADSTPMTDTMWLSGYPQHFRNFTRACIWLFPAQGKLADYNCNGNSRPFCTAPHDGGRAAKCS